jgi:ElaB/YqjD/DUF883 family membrane-anchored ribosome-binding protein
MNKDDSAEQALDQARRGYEETRANLHAIASDASERMGAAAGNAQAAVRSTSDILDGLIQERPLAIVALALGLGFLVGMNWRR